MNGLNKLRRLIKSDPFRSELNAERSVKSLKLSLSILFPIWCAVLGCIFILLAYHYHPQQPVKFTFRVILPVCSFQPSAVIWFQYQTGFGNVLKVSPSTTVTVVLAFVITLRTSLQRLLLNSLTCC